MILKKHHTAVFILSLISAQSFSQLSDVGISFGTTILVVGTQDSLIIAADSKVSHIRYPGSIGSEGKNKDLKVKCYDSIAYAFAGAVTLVDKYGQPLYDAGKLMGRLLIKYNSNIDSVFFYFNQRTVKIVDSVLHLMLPAQLEDIESKLNQRQLQIVIMSYKGQKPQYKFSEFGFIKSADSTIYTFVDMTEHYKIPFIAFLGITDNIRKWLADNGGLNLKRTYLQPSLITLIQYEASKNPQFIGEPYKVITLKKNGCNWFTPVFEGF